MYQVLLCRDYGRGLFAYASLISHFPTYSDARQVADCINSSFDLPLAGVHPTGTPGGLFDGLAAAVAVSDKTAWRW